MSYKIPKGILYNIKNDDERPEFNKETVMFEYLYENQKSSHIPVELLLNYTGERNLNNQTPLMYATKLNNINFINELLQYDIGALDDDNNSALDYAILFKSSPEIIAILEEFELPD